jgi:HEAT repeat protein
MRQLIPVLLIGLMLLSACGKSDESPIATPPTPPQQEITVKQPPPSPLQTPITPTGNTVVPVASGSSISPEEARSKQIKELVDQLANAETGKDEKLALDGLIGLNAQEAIPDLIKLLANEYPGKVITALQYLEAKEAIPEIIKLLDTGNTYAADSALRFLGWFQVKESIPEIMKFFQSDKFGDISQWSMVEAIVRINAREIIPDLIQIIKNSYDDDRPPVASNALILLDAKETIPELVKLLQSDNADTRGAAIRILGKMNHRESIPQIIDLLNDSSAKVKNESLKTLALLNAKESIPNIIPLLNDDSVDERTVIEALVKLNVRESIPELKKLLQEELSKKREDIGDNVMGRVIIGALWKLEAKEAISDLIQILKNKDEIQLHDSVIIALAKLGERAIIPDVRERIKVGFTPSEDLLDIPNISSFVAAYALAELSVTESIPELIELMSDNNIKYPAAIYALGKLGARQAIPQIAPLLQSDDLIVRYTAIEALGNLQAKETIPEIVKHMDEDYMAALPALAKLNATDAIPDIEKLLRKSNEFRQAYAVATLIKLGKKDNIPEKHIVTLRIFAQRFGHHDDELSDYFRSALKELGVEVPGNK